MNTFDFNRFKVKNPEALGEGEKDLVLKVDSVVSDVLDELKNRGNIEYIFVPKDMEPLDAVLQKLDDFSEVHNVLIHLTDSRSRFDEYLKAIAEFGFDEHRTIANYIMAASTVTVLSTELFKVLLLFITRDLSRKVSEFSGTLEKATPLSWPRLKPLVDNSLRNALAHGTYAIVDRKIRLYAEARLDKFEEMSLDKFMIRIKSQNILFQVLINVLRNKGEKGFFQP